MCLRKSIPCIGSKVTCSFLIPLSIPLGWLLLTELYTYVLAKILQNVGKVVQKLTPGFKNPWGISTTLAKHWNIQKVEIRWTIFVQKLHSFS